MHRERPFAQVDVFSEVALGGNPLAVVLDGGGLGDEAMARFARWTDLSETTFVLPPTTPGADLRVRIFTPTTELPFAGHPTLGTCHAWLEAGGRPADPGVVRMECGVGVVEVRRGAERLAFAAPPLRRSGSVDEETLGRVVAALRIAPDAVVDAAWVENGPAWIAILLTSPEEVLAIAPGYDDLDVGVVAPYPSGSEVALEVRAFFPQDGVLREDPVTGSLNAGIALWLLGAGRVRAPYVAAQGGAIGRAGRVHVDRDADGTTWIGGAATTVVRGTVDL